MRLGVVFGFFAPSLCVELQCWAYNSRKVGTEDERQKARKLKEDKLKKAEEYSSAILVSNKKKVNTLVKEIVELVVQTMHDEKGGE